MFSNAILVGDPGNVVTLILSVDTIWLVEYNLNKSFKLFILAFIVLKSVCEYNKVFKSWTSDLTWLCSTKIFRNESSS